MSEHDVEKLLGGFAADTLMPEERIRLYTAAMQDQQLFNALADEQALKELLADPNVRSRLLQSLQQPSTPTADNSYAWWELFKRPAGLAYAGGLATVFFAVAFGTKIYLQSLDRTTRSVATDNAPSLTAPQPTAPAQPSPLEPQPKSTERVHAANQAAKQDVLTDESTDRKRMAAPAAPREQRAERDEPRKQIEKSPAQPGADPARRVLEAPAGAPVTGAAMPALSARALFYASQPLRDDRQALAVGKDPASKSLSESSRMERFAATEKASGATTATRPLGLRYSFVVRDANGNEREVDAPSAAKSMGPVRITLEANQDAFLQILQSLGTAGTRLWWPPQETGKISLKVLAGKRSDIPLPPPAEGGLLNLIIRLSPKPFAPLTMQEVGMLDRFAANLLIESAAPGGADAQEQATYVVSQDPSRTAQMTVEIPIRR